MPARRRLLTLLVAAMAVAGCVGEEPPAESVSLAATAEGDPAGADAPASDAAADGAADAQDEAARANASDGNVPENATEVGRGLLTAASAAPLALGQRAQLAGICETTCAPTRLDLDVALDAWAMREGILEVRVRWNGTQQAGFALSVETPAGEPVVVQRGFDAARVLVLNPGAGAYVVRADGSGLLEGWAHVRHVAAFQGEGDDLLPNLVTLVPSNVHFGTCDPWEQVEQQAKRCLRLGNAVGNTGDGPLEVRLTPEGGAVTPAGMGEFVQRIHQREGEPREVPVGASEFHATHGHFHYHGLARFALHPVDPTTGLRSEAVASGHKAGFCLLDIGKLSGSDVHVESEPARHAEQDCLVPGKNGWTMGVSRGWYDLYGAGLTDQYVEATGVADGVYELVSETDWADTVLELDETDNAASVLLRISGDDVDVLEKRGFYVLPR